MGRRRLGHSMLWCGIALHAAWGVALLVDSRSLLAPPLSKFPDDVPASALGLAFISSSVLSVNAILRARKPWQALPLLFQQIALTTMGFAAVVAVTRGDSASGQDVDPSVVFSNQAALLAVVVFHTFALASYYSTLIRSAR